MDTLERAQPYLPELNARTLTIRRLAELLKTNESYLSRLLKPHLNRVVSTTELREKRSKLAESRRFMREKHANLVKNGQESLKKGAFYCKCSERTLRRYIAKLEL